MRYLTLFAYSHHKTTKELRTAIIFCKLSIILIIIGLVVLILGMVGGGGGGDWYRLSHRDDQPSNATTDEHSLSLVEAHTGASHMIERDNETLINANRVKDTRTSVEHQQYYGIVTLATGSVVMLCSLASSLFAYRNYQIYQRYRLVSYETVNRRFDYERRRELAKHHVREPIIATNNSKVYLPVDRRSRASKWLAAKSKHPNRSRPKEMTL